MKKTAAGLLCIFFILCIFVLFTRQNKGEKIFLMNESLEYKIKYRGLKGARDFTFDAEGNFYIAFKDKVEMIDSAGKSYILFSEKNMNIYSIAWKGNKLYYISDSTVKVYDIGQKMHGEIMNNLPNFGDYKESKLLIKEDNIFITIGAATNSGVVGKDNLWLRDNPFFYELTPKPLTLNRTLPRNVKTGAFVPQNTKNVPGQSIPAHFPGNASVIAYNITNGSSWLYLWGLRNVQGIDYSSEGQIYASVGGMEDRGTRPVKGDTDYIYELRENIWYGWPDYSGGDPVSSPKFKGINNEGLSFLLEQHPSTNPPAPFYQHKALGALMDIMIDRKGALGEKDSIYFYDCKDNIVYNINKQGVIKETLKLEKNANLKEMKSFDNNLYLLDDINGQLISLQAANAQTQSKDIKDVAYFVLLILLCSIIIIIWKFRIS